MSFESGVLVSLPANEMRNLQITGSIFELDVFRPADISPQLRNAILLFEDCVPPNVPKLIVARPEIFTDGDTLRWLTDHSRGVRDHMCFSDGATVRLIPGLRNHVYFFGLGAAAQLEGVSRLERRVPEIFAGVHSQFNTALNFRWKQKDVAPITYAAMPASEGERKDGPFRHLVINRHSIVDSVSRMAEAPPAALDFTQFDAWTYIRVTEAGFSNTQLARLLLWQVEDVLVRQTHAIVLVLPEVAGADANLVARLATVAHSLFGAGGRLPNVVVPNIFVTTEDMSLAALALLQGRKRLLIDEFADFWRSPSSFYEEFDEVIVYARKGRQASEQFNDLMRLAYGDKMAIHWLLPARDVHDARVR